MSQAASLAWRLLRAGDLPLPEEPAQAGHPGNVAAGRQEEHHHARQGVRRERDAARTGQPGAYHGVPLQNLEACPNIASQQHNTMANYFLLLQPTSCNLRIHRAGVSSDSMQYGVAGSPGAAPWGAAKALRRPRRLRLKLLSVNSSRRCAALRVWHNGLSEAHARFLQVNRYRIGCNGSMKPAGAAACAAAD